jgi:hypothetical protein
MDDFLTGLTKAADLSQDQINTIQQHLQSHQSVDDLLPGLVNYEKHFQRGLRIARQLGMERKEKPFKKILQRSRRLRARIEVIGRSRARSRAFFWKLSSHVKTLGGSCWEICFVRSSMGSLWARVELGTRISRRRAERGRERSDR